MTSTSIASLKLMVSRAAADDAAHVQKVQAVARADPLRHVADEALERSTPAERAHDHVAGIDLRQTTRRQFELVVRRAVFSRHGLRFTAFLVLSLSALSLIKPSASRWL